jgi:signal transduction histidine kinase
MTVSRQERAPKVESESGAVRATDEMRARIFWSLVGLSTLPTVVSLLVSADAWAVTAIICGFIVSWIAAYFMSYALTAPLRELHSRLRSRNHGAAQKLVVEGFNTGSSEAGVEVAAAFFANLDRKMKEGTPPHFARLTSEMVEIERLARAGRMSDIAMDSVKRDIFRHLSHQLKSPMASLRANSQRVRQRLDADDKPGAEQALKDIDDLAMSVSALVEQLLSMAWIENLEKKGVSGSTTNLSTAVLQVVRFQGMAARAKGIELVDAVSAGLKVTGEEQLLQEMVSSLVDNAIRYSPKGSKITIAAAQIPNTKTIAVSVTDQGPGVPAAERERVFEPFYGSIGVDDSGNTTYGTRRHRALNDAMVKSSHGLGLALVRSIARLHGADVMLEAGPNSVGLRARVLLNAAPSDLVPPDNSAIHVH